LDEAGAANKMAPQYVAGKQPTNISLSLNNTVGYIASSLPFPTHTGLSTALWVNKYTQQWTVNQ